MFLDNFLHFDRKTKDKNIKRTSQNQEYDYYYYYYDVLDYNSFLLLIII